MARRDTAGADAAGALPGLPGGGRRSRRAARALPSRTMSRKWRSLAFWQNATAQRRTAASRSVPSVVISGRLRVYWT